MAEVQRKRGKKVEFGADASRLRGQWPSTLWETKLPSRGKYKRGRIGRCRAQLARNDLGDEHSKTRDPGTPCALH